jgi:hypothetical protein
LVGFGGQRLVVDGDQAGDVALSGFDDVFGGVAVVVGFAEKRAEGAVGRGGVLAVLDGSADQGCPTARRGRWVDGLGGLGVGGWG